MKKKKKEAWMFVGLIVGVFAFLTFLAWYSGSFTISYEGGYVPPPEKNISSDEFMPVWNIQNSICIIDYVEKNSSFLSNSFLTETECTNKVPDRWYIKGTECIKLSKTEPMPSGIKQTYTLLQECQTTIDNTVVDIWRLEDFECVQQKMTYEIASKINFAPGQNMSSVAYYDDQTKCQLDLIDIIAKEKNAEVCGNKKCERFEDITTCAKDCDANYKEPIVEQPTLTTTTTTTTTQETTNSIASFFKSLISFLTGKGWKNG